MTVEISRYRGTSSVRSETTANLGSSLLKAAAYSSTVTRWDEGSETEATQSFVKSYSVRIRPAQRQARSGLGSQQSPPKTLRRLEGFLIEDQGEEYKVAFVEDGHLVFYYLPSSNLRKAGITAPNQPFQMDELELELPNGQNATGYTFVPLAKPSDSFPDPIEMTKERRGKLNAIFKRFGGKPKH
jgi:hypothetical protein